MKKAEMIMEISSFFNDRGHIVDNNTNLFDVGAIDSMSILELAIFLEERFDVKLTSLQMTAVHFQTIDSICLMLESFLD